MRLSPWLEKARANKTKSKKIMKELKKVKLLNVVEEKIKITEVNYYEMKMYEKRRARFVSREMLDKLEMTGMNGLMRGKTIKKWGWMAHDMGKSMGFIKNGKKGNKIKT